MTAPLVLYHAGCFDGHCAAYFFHRAIPDAEFIFVNYGQLPPDVTGRTVFVLDFCYPRVVLEKMAGEAERIVVLDHHKTAEADLSGFAHTNAIVRFDMTKSGARMTWEYLHEMGWLDRKMRKEHTRDDPHWLVAYTEDRDLWRWKLPNSKAINAALRSYPMTFDYWDRLGSGWSSLVGEGEAILRSEGQLVAAHASFAKEVTIGGVVGLAVNATCLQSEIAHELAKKGLFGACYVQRADGSQLWSLRSTETGVDVSALAKAMGGGGHRSAAGFMAKRSLWQGEP